MSSTIQISGCQPLASGMYWLNHYRKAGPVGGQPHVEPRRRVTSISAGTSAMIYSHVVERASGSTRERNE
jgi:hypothetical protein